MLTTALAGLVLASTGAPADPVTVKGKIVEVSLFKNGYAGVIREYDLAEGKDAQIEELPVSTIGTLWLASTAGTQIERVVATQTTSKSTVSLASIDEYLQQNVGKDVTLDCVSNPTITGKLVAASGTMLIVQVGEQMIAINKTDVKRATVGKGATVSRQVEVAKNVLRVTPKGKAGKLYLTTFEAGLSWMPAYAVELQNDKKLRVTQKATIINDLGDLQGIEARLVTGFPWIADMGARDPLTSFVQAVQMRDELRGSGMLQFDGRAGMLMNQAAPGGFGGGRGASPSEGFVVPNLGGVQTEDLFFYRQPNVTLKKGDRGYFVLQTFESDYRHVYTWSIPDSLGEQSNYQGLPDGPGEVWHTVRFQNSSPQPLTTGTGATYRDGELLGQDTVMYTSRAGEVTLKITKALDVRAEATEEETSRERQKVNVPNTGIWYDLVGIKGTIEVTNNKAEAVQVEITKVVSGDEVTGDGEPKVVKTAKGLREMNPRVRLSWDKKIEPGKTLRLSYAFRVFVRSN